MENNLTMKTLILISGDRVIMRRVTDFSDAEYQFRRRIEKEGFEADSAFLVDETNELPTKSWLEKYHADEMKYESERMEREQRETYLKLKKKFEANP